MTYLPYPEPRYRGETGEASARLRSADAAFRHIRLHDGNGWLDGRRATASTSRKGACTSSATSTAIPPRG